MVGGQAPKHWPRRPEGYTCYRSKEPLTWSCAHFDFGTTTMPHGLLPALIRPTSVSVFRSTTETSSEGPFAA